MEGLLASFIKIAVAHFLAVSTPGPDFFLVLRNSLMGTRKEGIYTSLGIMLGIGVHLIYCLLGLLIIIKSSDHLFLFLKYICAGYLFYLGQQAIRYRNAPQMANEGELGTARLTPFMAVRQGFICNLFNPKAILFFWSLFSVVISSTTPLWLQSAMALEMMFVNFWWFALVAYVATHPKFRKPLAQFQVWATRLMGVVLIYFGIELLIAKL